MRQYLHGSIDGLPGGTTFNRCCEVWRLLRWRDSDACSEQIPRPTLYHRFCLGDAERGYVSFRIGNRDVVFFVTQIQHRVNRWDVLRLQEVSCGT